MNKGVRFLLVLGMLSIFSLTACGGTDKEEAQKKEPNQVAVDEAGVEETETEEDIVYTDFDPNGKNINLLSGYPTLTEAAYGARPVAIMVNNVKKGMPQYGIAQADVVFEMVMEGGLSRVMALYGDYTQVPKVCSIRSCRKYFPEISEGFDAIYVCCGMNSATEAYVKTLKLDIFNGIYNDTLFARDKSRLDAGYSNEHTLYFDGTKLVKELEKEKIRTQLEADKTGTAFKFAEVDTKVIPTGEACKAVTVDFGDTKSTLRYDAKRNKYLKEFNGEKQIDGKTKKQLAFDNVIVMEAPIGTESNKVIRTVNWTGGSDSTAYFISNGKVQKIHYKKAGVESRLIFFDDAGNEIEINRGKTYIAVGFKGRTTLE